VKHTGKRGEWRFPDVRWRNNNSEVGIPNEKGDYEYFPAHYIDWYASAPPALLRKMAVVIENERVLSIGVVEAGHTLEEKVTIKEKRLFMLDTDEDDDDEFLFPELAHGQNVVLQGRLTRGNASTNSVGLEYQGHILNCVPEKGSIVKYKSALFLRCLVEGRVSRLHGSRLVPERKPTIIIKRVKPLEKDRQRPLF
jgi:hypothetical protein